MIDTHAHLDLKDYNYDRADVIKRAKAVGIRAIVNPAAYFDRLQIVIDTAEKYTGYVYPCSGLSPSECGDAKKVAETVAFCRAHKDDIVAIGEVGLEYKWTPQTKAEQEKALREFCQLSLEINKPLILHCRSTEGMNAVDDVMRILLEERVDRAVFHHYSGNVTQAKAVEEHGWLLSFSTVHVRNPNKSLIKAVSLESMVAETDSPFLDPSGKRNEPMNVKGVVDSIATVKGLPFDKIDSVIDDNARAFFGIR